MSNTDANVPLPDLEKSSMQPLPDGIADVNDSVTPLPAKMSLIFPIPMTAWPFPAIAFRIVRGGCME